MGDILSEILATTGNNFLMLKLFWNPSETNNNLFRLFDYIAHIVGHWHQELGMQYFLFLANHNWIQLIRLRRHPRFQHGKNLQKLRNVSESCIK